MPATRLLLILTAVLLLGGAQTRLSGPEAQAAFPGDNGKVLFTRVTGSSVDLYTVSPDGTGEAPLLAGPDNDSRASWSPDGRQVAFIRTNTGPPSTFSLMLINADGTGIRQVTTASLDGPSWSPDGEKIAFQKDGDIFIITLATGAIDNITNDSTLQFTPKWSPVGDKIAFVQSGSPIKVILMGVDSSGRTTLVDGGFPAWSPDGQRIAYKPTTGNGFEIRDIAATGGGSRHIIDTNAVGSVSLEYSPNGAEIVYADADTPDSSAVVSTFAVDANGGNRRRVSAGPFDLFPDWQPLPNFVQVEFTQAIQGLQSVSALRNDLQSDGKPPVPIVAGKAAVMRVYFDEVDVATDYLVELTGQIQQADHFTIQPGCTAVERRRNESGCDSLDYYFMPPQGNWAVHLKVSDTSEGSVLLDETFDLTSVDTSGLIVKYIPVCVRMMPGAGYTCPGNFIGTTAPDLMKKLYPVADDEFFYDALATPSLNYNAPITNDDRVIADLRTRYNLMSQGGFVADQLAGWLAPNTTATGTLGYADPVWAGSTGRVSWQVDTSAADPIDPQHTLAHEIGHNLGLRHVNLADGCGAQDSTTDWPYADSTIQEVGFDVAAQQVMLPTKKDLMTYCTPPGSDIWISPFTFTKLLEGDFTPQAVRMGPAGAAAGQFLVIRGTVQADGSAASIDSAYVIDSATPADAPDPLGNHCLHLTGSVESDYCFALEFEDHRSHEPVESEAFALRVPLPPGTTRVALMHGAVELDALEASASAPTLAIDEPESLSGDETITWTSSDGDSDPLQYAVMYSPDGGDTWLPLEVDATDAEFSLDTSLLAGDEVLIRVLASDGLNTTVETTGPVTLSRGLSGDVDCSGAVNSIDALKLSRHVAGLSVAQTGPCPDVGTGDGDVFGDVNCDGNITAVDTLFVLRFVAALPANVSQGCRPVGT